MELAYGNGFITIDIRAPYDFNILKHDTVIPSFDIESEISKCFNSLDDCLHARRPRSVVILAEDKTRKNPEYPILLNRLIQLLKRNNINTIKLIPAYGTHKPHSKSEHIKLYGTENLGQARLIEHDCRDEASLGYIGNLPSGTPIKINSAVIQNDFRIALGSVSPHAFAGFTGGPKIILPGVANYEAIRESHSHVVSQQADIGILEGNPVHENIMSTLEQIDVDFTVQTVREIDGKLAAIFYGDMKTSFEKAVNFCRNTCSIHVPHNINAIIVGCGGLPRDESLYQAQRVISIATKAIKPGGFAIVVGEFSQGIGNDLLERSLGLPQKEILSMKPECIEIGMHSAYLMSRNLARAEVTFITSLDDEICRKTSLVKIDNHKQINSYLSKKIQAGNVIHIIPNGSNILIGKQ
jgi:nickel-dependent lactate racemase